MGMVRLAEKRNCTACYACVNACPKGCISMEADACGSLYPTIDSASCVECGRCEKACPCLHEVSRSRPRQVYAAYSRCEETVKHCASGGVATELARLTLEQGGVVYGAAMLENEVCHVRVDAEEQLAVLSGSKYVHSHIKGAYSQIGKDLAEGRGVTVIATPCQIAGLLGYLGEKPDNLLTVDLLCHGVPSLDCFLQGVALETDRPVSSVTFRDESGYCLVGYEGESRVFCTPYRASFWLNGFVEGYLFRENCYSCSYAGETRCGDLTLGDFWGLESGWNVRTGVNMVAVNSDEGAAMWNMLCDRLVFEERSLAEAAKHNHSLTAPVPRPRQYDTFLRLYRTKGGRAAILGAYPHKTLYIRARRALRGHPRLSGFVTAIPVVGKRLKVRWE